ncbi:hypothetical protein ABZ297_15955 [Nonomuraea sp. NPDC005983]|uniref:hypothetical protein n=1 Tax=Nonomuraea sp. NPDC005983 TaxID=3155595 RepID=UPI0033B4790E
MEIPELAELIWLFEDEPQSQYEDVHWPVGLHSFRDGTIRQEESAAGGDFVP